MPDVTLNSGQSSSITRTVRLSCFQGDNRQRGTEEGEPIVFVFWFTCCKIVYWLLMLSSVIVSGRYIAWCDPCSGPRSHNHFSNKSWKFIAVTSDLQVRLDFFKRQKRLFTTLTFTFGCWHCLLNYPEWSRTAVALHLPAMCFHWGNCSVFQECTV